MPKNQTKRAEKGGSQPKEEEMKKTAHFSLRFRISKYAEIQIL
jgi:hypothetical protein